MGKQPENQCTNVALLMLGMPTLETEALHHVSNVQLVKIPFTVKERTALRTLLFFGRNSGCALLLRPRPSIKLIANLMYRN